MLPDPRLRRIFSFQALYAGVAPDRALGAYGVIAYMDTVAGVWFPRGGMRGAGHRAGRGGRRRRRRAAARTRGHRPGAQRRRPGERRPAPRRGHERHAGRLTACDAVVLTPELPTPTGCSATRLDARCALRWAPSAAVVHVGVPADRAPRDAQHHTISFGDAWTTTFDEIVDRGELMSDPSLLVTRPGRTDPGLAPPGRELVSVLAPCPNTDRARFDWPRIGPAYADELRDVLAAAGSSTPAVEPSWTRLFTPRRLGAAPGWPRAPRSPPRTRLAQTGPFRPRNLVRSASNVVLAGCGTTPGVGIPPVLISGRLAAERITGAAAPRT